MAMTRGQKSLIMTLEMPVHKNVNVQNSDAPLLVKLANAQELIAHEEYLTGLAKSGNCIWNS